MKLHLKSVIISSLSFCYICGDGYAAPLAGSTASDSEYFKEEQIKLNAELTKVQQLLDLKMYPECMAKLDSYIVNNHMDANAHFMKGYLYLHVFYKGLWNKANMNSFRDIVAISTDRPSNLQTIEDSFDRAIKISPEFSQKIAKLYFNEAFNNASQFDPNVLLLFLQRSKKSDSLTYYSMLEKKIKTIAKVVEPQYNLLVNCIDRYEDMEAMYKSLAKDFISTLNPADTKIWQEALTSYFKSMTPIFLKLAPEDQKKLDLVQGECFKDIFAKCYSMDKASFEEYFNLPWRSEFFNVETRFYQKYSSFWAINNAEDWKQLLKSVNTVEIQNFLKMMNVIGCNEKDGKYMVVQSVIGYIDTLDEDTIVKRFNEEIDKNNFLNASQILASISNNFTSELISKSRYNSLVCRLADSLQDQEQWDRIRTTNFETYNGFSGRLKTYHEFLQAFSVKSALNARELLVKIQKDTLDYGVADKIALLRPAISGTYISGMSKLSKDFPCAKLNLEFDDIRYVFKGTIIRWPTVSLETNGYSALKETPITGTYDPFSKEIKISVLNSEKVKTYSDLSVAGVFEFGKIRCHTIKYGNFKSRVDVKLDKGEAKDSSPIGTYTNSNNKNMSLTFNDEKSGVYKSGKSEFSFAASHSDFGEMVVSGKSSDGKQAIEYKLMVVNDKMLAGVSSGGKANVYFLKE